MTTKSLLFLGALTLSTLRIASAKSFDVIFTSPAMAGSTQLQPGQYKLKVDGSQATFVQTDGTKSFTVPVKVENSATKFDHTSVNTTNQNGMDNIQSINLAGSTTKLEFGQ